jgi:hypothetical protein
MLTALIPAVILGLIVFVAVSLRGRDGPDLSPGGLLRLYLYLASLAGVVVFVVGLSSLVNVAFAVTAGNDFTYGRPPEMTAFACPPNTSECEAARARELALNPPERMLEQRDRRRGDDLVRGLTFTVFGALFWGPHWFARRSLGADSLASSCRRGYLMAGTLLFGLVTVVLLPWGTYQALSAAFLPPAPNQFNSGVADTLGGGLAALPIWLIYLRLVMRDVRSQATA